MGGVSLKNEKEELYASKSERKFKQHANHGSKENVDKPKCHRRERTIREGRGLNNHDNNKKLKGKCSNCGKNGHMERACSSKKKARGE